MPISAELDCKINGVADQLYKFLKNNSRELLTGQEGTEKYKQIFKELFKLCQEKVRELAKAKDLQPEFSEDSKEKTFK